MDRGDAIVVEEAVGASGGIDTVSCIMEHMCRVEKIGFLLRSASGKEYTLIFGWYAHPNREHSLEDSLGTGVANATHFAG